VEERSARPGAERNVPSRTRPGSGMARHCERTSGFLASERETKGEHAGPGKPVEEKPEPALLFAAQQPGGRATRARLVVEWHSLFITNIHYDMARDCCLQVKSSHNSVWNEADFGGECVDWWRQLLLP
jgi:hypothetical protein